VRRRPPYSAHTRHIVGIVGTLRLVSKFAEYVPSMRSDAGISGRSLPSCQIEAAALAPPPLQSNRPGEFRDARRRSQCTPNTFQPDPAFSASPAPWCYQATTSVVRNGTGCALLRFRLRLGSSKAIASRWHHTVEEMDPRDWVIRQPATDNCRDRFGDPAAP